MSDIGEEDQDNSTTVRAEQIQLRLDETSVLLPPTDDSRIVRIAVQAVHCYPTNGEQSKYSRRVMNALVVNAQDIFERLSESDRANVRRWHGTPRFTINMARMKSLLGKDFTNYNLVYDAIAAIRKWEIKWDVMGDFDTGERTSVVDASFISQWERGEGKLAGQISYFFPHDVMMMLMEPARYAQIDLHAVNAMGSSYAIELYHQCARYVGTAQKVTSVLPLDEWIMLIAGPGKYAGRYKDFKRYALAPAMKWLELVDSCPFTVEIREMVGARKRVMGLQFKLQMKRQASLDMRMPPSWDPRTIDTLRKVYLMQTREISELALSASEVEVQEAMKRDSAMVTRKVAQGAPIKNRADYLRGILRNVQSGKQKDAEPIDTDDETPTRQVQNAVARVNQLKEEFERFRSARLGVMLGGLPSNALDELRAEFTQARGREAVISTWLKKGWDKAMPSLHAAFTAWFKASHPETADNMLAAPEERDFNVWLLVRDSADDAANLIPRLKSTGNGA